MQQVHPETIFFMQTKEYEESTHWKDPDAWKDCGQEEKGATQYEMIGWHH